MPVKPSARPILSVRGVDYREVIKRLFKVIEDLNDTPVLRKEPGIFKLRRVWTHFR